MSNDFLWVEKYRPKTIGETILPSDLKATFQKIVETGEVPNMLFTGSAGLGLTRWVFFCSKLINTKLLITFLLKACICHFFSLALEWLRARVFTYIPNDKLSVKINEKKLTKSIRELENFS